MESGGMSAFQRNQKTAYPNGYKWNEMDTNGLLLFRLEHTYNGNYISNFKFKFRFIFTFTVSVSVSRNGAA